MATAVIDRWAITRERTHDQTTAAVALKWRRNGGGGGGGAPLKADGASKVVRLGAFHEAFGRAFTRY